MSIAMMQALKTPGLTSSERTVFAYLVGRAFSDRKCCVSMDEMQADLGIKTRHTVCGATSKLVQIGRLAAKRQFAAENHYTILDPDGWLYGAVDIRQDQAEDGAETGLEGHVLPVVRKNAQRQDVQKTTQLAVVRKNHTEAAPVVRKIALADVQKTTRDSIPPVKKSLRPTPESLNLDSTPPHTTRTRKARARDVAVLSPEDAMNFQEFYSAYPRHEAPLTARKAYASALARGVDHHRIMVGLRRYRFKPERQYQPLPATWLNAGNYDAEFPAIEVTAPPKEGVTDSLRRRLNLWAEQDDDDDRPNAPTIDQPLALEHVG